jgi:uncharacterized membrane protein
MRPLPLVLVLRLSLLVAIAASAALVIEYQNAGDPAFCGVGSGCFAVRIYSKSWGMFLPYFGLLAHAGLLAASLIARTRDHHRFVALLASAGAAAALVLLYLQHFVIGAICAWCFAVDIASIIAAAAAVGIALQAIKAPPPAPTDPFWRATTPGPKETLIWGVAAALAIALPFIWGRYPVIPPLPQPVQALQVPGKLTIVSFTDFQCPFCRRLHPEMHKLEAQHGERLHIHRRMMPLPSHAGALPAAQAYLCAPEAKREAAAEWLYNAPDADLNRVGVLAMADVVGISKIDLATCMTSPATQDALARDKALYDSLSARGLPWTYVGPRMVIGFDPERIARSIEAELQGDQMSLKLPWLFVALGVIFAGALVATWRIKAAAPEAARA